MFKLYPFPHSLEGGTVASPLACTLMEKMLRNGEIDNAIWELRKLYEERAAALVDGLALNCPSITVQSKVEGGYFIWCKLPHFIEDARKFASYCVNHHDLNFLPGQACFHNPPQDGTADRTIRLCFAMYSAGDLTEATRRLKSAMEQYQTRNLYS
jgi:2-aminoadipate transaminase